MNLVIRHPIFKHLTIAAMGFSFCSCIAPQTRQVPFEESAFARYGGSGPGSVTGVAVTTTQGNRTTADHNNTIKLMPATPYTDEVVQQVYIGRQSLQPPDPRFMKYLRKIHPDDKGDFAFRNLPPGEYYVSCDMSTSVDTSYSDANGNMTWSSSTEGGWIYKRVSVRNGQTANVTQWDEGK